VSKKPAAAAFGGVEHHWFLGQFEHGPGIDFPSFSSLESKGKYLFVDRGKFKSMKSYEKMGR
jgi:hypothetical protein